MPEPPPHYFCGLSHSVIYEFSSFNRNCDRCSCRRNLLCCLRTDERSTQGRVIRFFYSSKVFRKASKGDTPCQDDSCGRDYFKHCFWDDDIHTTRWSSGCSYRISAHENDLTKKIQFNKEMSGRREEKALFAPSFVRPYMTHGPARNHANRRISKLPKLRHYKVLLSVCPTLTVVSGYCGEAAGVQRLEEKLENQAGQFREQESPSTPPPYLRDRQRVF